MLPEASIQIIIDNLLLIIFWIPVFTGMTRQIAFLPKASMSIVLSRRREAAELIKLERTEGRNAVSMSGQPHGIAHTRE